MIELVGCNIWRKGARPAVEDLSEVDRTYSFATAQDDGSSRTGDVTRQTGGNGDFIGRIPRSCGV